ncbi:MAG TPA: hypothetical protein EYP65_02260 [Armatimonadetes bacterium]|nr:hypothetical protein [Armatimonadota bacterium]
MDQAVREFLVSVINSRVKLDLVLHFHRNRYTLDYAGGVAQKVGRREEEVRRALEELVEAGVVVRHTSKLHSDRPPIYAYTRDPRTQALVARLAEYCSSEGGRREVETIIDNAGGEERK